MSYIIFLAFDLLFHILPSYRVFNLFLLFSMENSKFGYFCAIGTGNKQPMQRKRQKVEGEGNATEKQLRNCNCNIT